jgi:hypothetical protein
LPLVVSRGGGGGGGGGGGTVEPPAFVEDAVKSGGGGGGNGTPPRAPTCAASEFAAPTSAGPLDTALEPEENAFFISSGRFVVSIVPFDGSNPTWATCLKPVGFPTTKLSGFPLVFLSFFDFFLSLSLLLICYQEQENEELLR